MGILTKNHMICCLRKLNIKKIIFKFWPMQHHYDSWLFAHYKFSYYNVTTIVHMILILNLENISQSVWDWSTLWSASSDFRTVIRVRHFAIGSVQRASWIVMDQWFVQNVDKATLDETVNGLQSTTLEFIYRVTR